MTDNLSRPPLDGPALRRELTGPRSPWRRLDVVDETGSTNADLIARAAAGDDIAGSVLLAEGDAEAGLAALRRASAGWSALGMPYETARARVAIADGCRDRRRYEPAVSPGHRHRDVTVSDTVTPG